MNLPLLQAEGGGGGGGALNSLRNFRLQKKKFTPSFGNSDSSQVREALKNGKIKDLVLNCTIFLPPPLGKGPANKLDEFLEKFQTAFDPPPSFLENYVAFFYIGYGHIHARRHRPDSIS